MGPVESNNQLITQQRRDQELQIVSEDCNTKKKVGFRFTKYFEFFIILGDFFCSFRDRSAQVITIFLLLKLLINFWFKILSL